MKNTALDVVCPLAHFCITNSLVSEGAAGTTGYLAALTKEKV